jgi:glycosyltransferase involved in cell wall biosynthesis
MDRHIDNAIYINGRFLTHRQTGVERYSREVVAAIDRLLSREDCSPVLRSLDWELLAPPGTRCDLKLERIRFREIGSGSGHLWEQLCLARHAWAGRLLSPANSGPIRHPRQIVVIHDASIYKAPAGYTRKYRLFHRLLDGFLARSATIATVSQFSRQELASCLRISAEDILVAENGTDHFKVVAPDAAIVDRLKLKHGKYFVTLGLSNANKNIPLAIEAYALLNRPDTKLVVVGKGSAHGLGSQRFKRSQGVIFPGRLTDEEVTGLLRSATALLFPSRYEGFGIPPLEAMVQGCPVIASTAGAVLEVCGDAALHFHPDHARALRDLMRRILEDPDVAEEMRTRGLGRPDRSQWDATAEVLIRGLKDLGVTSKAQKIPVTEYDYEKTSPLR